VFTEHFTS